jgi:hypothetical protein
MNVMKNKDENTDPENMNESVGPAEARKMFAALSHPEFRKRISEEQMAEFMDAAIGILEERLKDAGLNISDFAMSVHELFDTYCTKTSNLPKFLAELEELQIEWHDYIFDPKQVLQWCLPVLAPHLEIDSLMRQAVKRAGLYASPQTVYSAALRIIDEQKATAS